MCVTGDVCRHVHVRMHVYYVYVYTHVCGLVKRVTIDLHDWEEGVRKKVWGRRCEEEGVRKKV